MLIDTIVDCLTDGELTFDNDGALAAQGKVDESLLADLMDVPTDAKVAIAFAVLAHET